ncbi:SDR family oxidoreductase [Actinomadura madurae]|uniref:SDR family NAD(P)-dependent oxidoreductase n=1 Tax=Actinomadura madurae TaxID=1993 RepID=UPI002026B240|nr:SDR family NAD(P)-dependent oxidoreductase [Actinomadura madurae]URM93825.1 SDR family oxidoreductase [Actinomadura madurae]URN04548.1 SDR family oxidoreductase [Actinomadura madurae]
MRGLQDKVIVVAGGATGIGAATARRLAEEGAKVVIGDINPTGAKDTVEEIRAHGGHAVAHEFDISSEESCAALMAAAVEAFGGIDGLFNVAADLSADTLGRDADLLSVPVEVWHRSLAVNLTGYFYTARHAVPRLLERGGGAIVNTISGLVLNGDRGRVSYGASKSGLLAMSKHIATRWGKEGIRCNVVAPGMVLTDNSMAMIGEQERAAVLEMLRSPRFGEPEDIAAAVTFLLSEDGSWINGQVLPVNGGTGLR